MAFFVRTPAPTPTLTQSTDVSKHRAPNTTTANTYLVKHGGVFEPRGGQRAHRVDGVEERL